MQQIRVLLFEVLAVWQKTPEQKEDKISLKAEKRPQRN